MTKGLILLILVVVLDSCCGISNPYNVLHVKRSDSDATIKKAYRKLALELHPDKNDDPSAQDEMMKVNEAYQILSDPEKKAEYDNFGTVSQGEQNGQGAHNHFYHEFRGPGGQYSFMFEDLPFGSYFHSHDYQKKNILNEYNYKNIVKADSYHKVFLILVLHDMCYECLRIQGLWEKLTQTLNTIGIGTYELFYNREPRLAHEIGANAYPQFIGVVADRNIRYKNDMSERSIRDFLATILPHHMITNIVENERDFFEKSFVDNKPQVMLFSKHSYPPLLFSVVAYEYHTKVKFAYVHTKDLRTKKLLLKYNLNPSEPSVVVLKEEPSSPANIVRGSALKRGTLRDLVTSNLYFVVPRLSSQEILDELCPKRSGTRRVLCGILFITKEGGNSSSHLYMLRRLANDASLKDKRVQLFYVFTDVQREFVGCFTEGHSTYSVPCSDGSLPLKLLIFWRNLKGKVYYDWFSNGWCKDSRSNVLLEFLEDHVSNQLEMKYETSITDVQDEHWHGYLWDVIKKSYAIVHHIVDSLDHPSWNNASSIGFVLIVIIMLFIGLVLPFIGGSSPYKSRYTDSESLPRHTPPEVSTTVLGLLKFDHKSEDKLLHKAPPGNLTIAVLVDSADLDDVVSSPVIQAFADSIYSYSRDANYTFTWLPLSENMAWCIDVLNLNKFGELIPGCVIVCNGYRKYIYMYKPNIGHAKSNKNTSQISADFIGLESSEDEAGDSYQHMKRLKVKKAAIRLREELPRWLDRLFQGLLKDKIRIDKWPRMEKM